jgi:hypothetical protein
MRRRTPKKKRGRPAWSTWRRRWLFWLLADFHAAFAAADPQPYSYLVRLGNQWCRTLKLPSMPTPSLSVLDTDGDKTHLLRERTAVKAWCNDKFDSVRDISSVMFDVNDGSFNIGGIRGKAVPGDWDKLRDDIEEVVGGMGVQGSYPSKAAAPEPQQQKASPPKPSTAGLQNVAAAAADAVDAADDVSANAAAENETPATAAREVCFTDSSGGKHVFTVTQTRGFSAKLKHEVDGLNARCVHNAHTLIISDRYRYATCDLLTR